MTETVLTQAEIDVIAERRRHVAVEGWTPQHDDRYQNQELGYAAAAYAGPIWADAAAQERGDLPIGWPWDPRWYKPRTRRENLVRAASLILADIESIDRASGATPSPAPVPPPVLKEATSEASPAPVSEVTVSEHPFLRFIDIPEDTAVSELSMLTRDPATGEKRADSVGIENVRLPSIEAAENYVIAFLGNPIVSKGATAYPGEDRPYANEANALVINYAANLIHQDGHRGRGNIVLMHRDDLPLLISKPSTAFEPVDVARTHGRWTLVGTLNDMEVWVTTSMPPRVWRGQAIVLYSGRNVADRVATVAVQGSDIKIALQRCGRARVVNDFIRVVDMYPERRQPVSLYT